MAPNSWQQLVRANLLKQIMPASSQDPKRTSPTTISSGVTKPARTKRVSYTDAELNAIKQALTELKPDKITINITHEILEKYPGVFALRCTLETIKQRLLSCCLSSQV
jgi:hypothetical protein